MIHDSDVTAIENVCFVCFRKINYLQKKKKKLQIEQLHLITSHLRGLSWHRDTPTTCETDMHFLSLEKKEYSKKKKASNKKQNKNSRMPKLMNRNHSNRWLRFKL